MATIAAASPPPALPNALVSYTIDGQFRPGDYGWLRGKFEGATSKQILEYRDMERWRRGCFDADLARTRTELQTIGITTGPALNHMPSSTLVCGQVATLPEPLDLTDWTGFSRDVAAVRSTIDGFLDAVTLSRNLGLGNGDDLGPALIARALEEQTLRAALVWSDNPSAFEHVRAQLSARERAIFRAVIVTAIEEEDHDNTAWLKQKMQQRGWPRQSEVGKKAAKMAWLLAQHADADPVFQIRALRLMEPLVAAGEADGRDFAFLYDRVMLSISGRQRYATQLACSRGRLEPLPLEDEAKVVSWRRTVGLEDLDAEKASILKLVGGCGSGGGPGR